MGSLSVLLQIQGIAREFVFGDVTEIVLGLRDSKRNDGAAKNPRTGLRTRK